MRQWPGSGEAAAVEGVTGCVLSNELLDAMPVHRVTVRGGKLLELFVTVRDGEFVEVAGELSTPDLEECLGREGISLPEGYVSEVNLGIDPFFDQVERMLARGFVLSIDYGYPAV